MKRALVLAIIAAATHCTQSSQVFAPVNNVATGGTTTPATYTLTLNIVPSNTNHLNKPVSILLFRNGTLYAARYDAAAQTDGSGAATLVLDGVDGNNCQTTGMPAALEAGTYTLYFAVPFAAETATSWAKPTGCGGGNGWINSSSGGNLYGTTATVSISADTNFTINGTNLGLLRKHTFDFQAGAATYTCSVTDISVTASAATMQPLAIYTRGTTGTTEGDGTNTFLLPSASFRYFCTRGASTASGVLSVTGATTTYLGTGDFTP